MSSGLCTTIFFTERTTFHKRLKRIIIHYQEPALNLSFNFLSVVSCKVDYVFGKAQPYFYNTGFYKYTIMVDFLKSKYSVSFVVFIAVES